MTLGSRVGFEVGSCNAHKGVIMSIRTTAVVAAAAAALFAAGTIASVAQAQSGIKCVGGNSCKGQSACKSATNACKGQNACKGKGFITASTTLECQASGGRPG
jgi:hypothetical protein